jgi:imidazolonepropionase-like amidohydrolase
MDTTTALGSATRTAGEKLTHGRRPDFGRIAVGSRADLLVVTADPLRAPDTLARPELVVAAGRVSFDAASQVPRREPPHGPANPSTSRA